MLILWKGFGIHPYQIAQNFLANQRLHFVDDQELNPLVYAEGFVDPDPTKAQDPTELLRKARLILATELGRDPLLRNAIRKAFKDEGVISVEPTERGVGKILETHPYFVSFSLAAQHRQCLDHSPELQVSPT